MIRFSPLALAAAMLASSISALGATSAAAEDAIHVSYRDLDLSSAHGQATLALRLRHAADTLCFAGKTRELAPLKACRSDVMASVRPAIQLAMGGHGADGATGSAAARTLR